MFPSSTTTIADLKLALSERVHIEQSGSDGARVVPTSVDAADRLTRAIQEGINEFCDERLWGWMRRTVSVVLSTDGTAGNCIDASNVRYAMPPGMAAIPDETRFPLYAPTGGVAGIARLVDQMTIERHRAASPDGVGTPTMVAFGQSYRMSTTPSAPTATDGRPLMQMQVFPQPSQAYTIVFECFQRPAKITDDKQVGPWPAVHDQTILAFAVLAFERTARTADSAALQEAKNEAARRLSISVMQDNALEAAPREAPVSFDATPSVVLRDYDGNRL